MVPNQNAGVQTGRTVTPRNVLRDQLHTIIVPGTIDGTKGIDGSNTGYTYIIRAGWLMGQITTTKKWVPLKRTRTQSFSSSGQSVQSPASTRIKVDNAAAFAVGDVITVGGDASLTITAIDYAKNHITVSSAILFTANEQVYATDGSGVCRGVLLDDEVMLRNYENLAAANKPCNILIHGYVDESQLLGDLTTVKADASTHYIDKKIILDGDYGN